MTLKAKPFKIKKFYVLCFIVSLLVLYSFITILENMKLYDNPSLFGGGPTTTTTTTMATILHFNYLKKNQEIIPQDLFKNSEFRERLMKEKVARLERKYNKSRSILLNSKPMLKPNYNVHIFYYSWYRNVEKDGFYRHWNHEYLENWKKDGRMYPSGTHQPPEDIGSNFYPLLGCYSSNDQATINLHFKQIRDAGIGVVVVSWTPPNTTNSDSKILPQIFESAFKNHLKVSIHVEPYPGRNPINLREHLRVFFQQFGQHPALYKIRKPLGQKIVPVVYIYDSYLIPAVAWKELLSSKGNLSLRNGPLDAIYIGLLVEVQHKYHIKKSQFDGFYTYFATNSFTYGSTWKNWRSLSKFAVQNGLIFVPSVGPGYIDTRVRPWNKANSRDRRHGQYYDVAWRSAINNNANYVSITSFNEWHEGTQIEPALGGAKYDNGRYMDYGPEGPFFYLNLTKVWIEQFAKSLG